MAKPYEARLRESFDSTLQEAAEFFMGKGDVRVTMRRLAARLAAEAIPYAVVGGMALGEHGYVRMTDDIDVLLTREGLARFTKACSGRGYTRAHPGARRMFRDTETGVRVEFLVAGEYPGDGKPKPVSFPDPVDCSVEVEGVRVVSLPRLIELKLASGMTAPDRLRDLADVQELIRAEQLTARFATELDPSVRSKFRELVQLVRRARRKR
ncbi:MAG: hypothetical protein ACHQ4J_05715 [Candidatus Binatia bacterium]